MFILAAFARVEPVLRKSITFDNDIAFAQHTLLRTIRAMTIRFCDAYASWQKAGVEYANGRSRRWLPRQIDVDKVSDEEIHDNSRPENAWLQDPFSRQSLSSLAKTCKSALRIPLAPESRSDVPLRLNNADSRCQTSEGHLTGSDKN
jgi:hypothetical protein